MTDVHELIQEAAVALLDAVSTIASEKMPDFWRVRDDTEYNRDVFAMMVMERSKMLLDERLVAIEEDEGYIDA
jgi:hypothetical protein